MTTHQLMLIIILPLIFAPFSTATETEFSNVDNLSADQKLILGERMYREGVLPSGEPMLSMVAGDVPVDGRMFTCVNCHQRSGQGSIEGSVIAWPINGKQLYTPRRRTGAWNAAKQKQGPGALQRWKLPAQYQAFDARPAYTDETLARLLRDGVDPSGRILNRGMPRYQINERDMSLLIYYLKNLSKEDDVGVDSDKIRFATVVTQGVSSEDRQAMLVVLNTHIKTHNTQTRPHQRRAKAGPFYKTEQYGAYRLFELDLWELQGAQDTWRSQLEIFYQDRPVFAMLGGIAKGNWAPIHHFCEDRKLPCIFPITDQPVVSDNDWYTLYFSKGLYQEGQTAAGYLLGIKKIADGAEVAQLYRADNRGKLLARGFREKLDGSKTIKVKDTVLALNQPITGKLLRQVFNKGDPAAVQLWLDEKDIGTVMELLTNHSLRAGQQVMMFASWTLIQGDTSDIPDRFHKNLYFTFPRDLPNDRLIKSKVLKRWLKARKIPTTNLDIQSQMYFLGWMLPGAISHIRSEFFRDYFIESFDMMNDQDYAIPIFPRLTFGVGQRYAAKGCYVVQLGEGKQPKLLKKSEWINH